MGIYYKGNIMGNASHMRQEMKRSNTNLGFDIDVTNGEWDLESTNMIGMVYIKVGQSPQIVNGLGLRENLHETILKKHIQQKQLWWVSKIGKYWPCVNDTILENWGKVPQKTLVLSEKMRCSAIASRQMGLAQKTGTESWHCTCSFTNYTKIESTILRSKNSIDILHVVGSFWHSNFLGISNFVTHFGMV